MEGGGGSSNATSLWPDSAPIPSDPHMQCIASALFQYSKSAEDPNDAFFAFLYYHHIGSIDMEFTSCLQSNDFFAQLVACALDKFIVEEPCDHVYVDDVKKRLADVIEGYMPLYGWMVPHLFSTKDTSRPSLLRDSTHHAAGSQAATF